MNKQHVPKLSICIPTYNRAEKLRRLILSISNQDCLEEVEICVSDNASKDHTREVVDSFRSNFNVHYSVNEENIGFCSNLLKVVNMAKGAYIWVIGDDDTFIDGAFKHVISILSDKAPDIIHVKVFHHARNQYFKSVADDVLLNRSEYSSLMMAEHLYSPGYIGANIFRGELIAAIDIPDVVTTTAWPHLFLLLNIFPKVEAAFVTKPLIDQIGDGLFWEPDNWLAIQFGKVVIVDYLISHGVLENKYGTRLARKILFDMRALYNLIQVLVSGKERFKKIIPIISQYRRNRFTRFYFLLWMAELTARFIALFPIAFIYRLLHPVLGVGIRERFDPVSMDKKNEGMQRKIY